MKQGRYNPIIPYIRKGRIDQKVAEKHGLHWALTNLAEAASKLTKEEIEEEKVKESPLL